MPPTPAGKLARDSKRPSGPNQLSGVGFGRNCAEYSGPTTVFKVCRSYSTDYFRIRDIATGHDSFGVKHVCSSNWLGDETLEGSGAQLEIESAALRFLRAVRLCVVFNPLHRLVCGLLSRIASDASTMAVHPNSGARSWAFAWVPVIRKFVYLLVGKNI